MAAKQPLPFCRSSYCTIQAGPAHRHAQRAARHPRLVVVERRPHNVHRAAVLHKDECMAAWQGAISCDGWAVPCGAPPRKAQAPPPPQACRVVPMAAGTAVPAQQQERKLAFTSTAPPSCPQLRSNAELVTDRLAPSSSSTAPPPAGGGCGRLGTAGMSQVGRWKACRHGRGMGSLRLEATCRWDSCRMRPHTPPPAGAMPCRPAKQGMF